MFSPLFPYPVLNFEYDIAYGYGVDLTRKDLLKSGAAAATSLLLAKDLGLPRSASAGPRPDAAGMNVILFLTDQERAIQHFPKGWAGRNLPGLTRLRRHGVEFTNAFTNACMCSPARSTLMSGYFPAQHGVKYTLEEDMPASEYPQSELPRRLPNLATVLAGAGYNPVYKGKWHCSKPAGSEWAPSDLAEYGFSRWNPPDAGANQEISEAGGGKEDKASLWNPRETNREPGPWLGILALPVDARPAAANAQR